MNLLPWPLFHGGSVWIFALSAMAMAMAMAGLLWVWRLPRYRLRRHARRARRELSETPAPSLARAGRRCCAVRCIVQVAASASRTDTPRWSAPWTFRSLAFGDEVWLRKTLENGADAEVGAGSFHFASTA